MADIALMVFVFFTTLLGFAPAASCMAVQEGDRGRAILEAVAEKRESLRHFEGIVTHSIESDSRKTTREYDVKHLGEKLWSHERVFADGELQEEVYFLRLGPEIYYHWPGQSGVQLKAATGGDFTESIVPRNIGLAIRASDTRSVRELLQLNRPRESEFSIVSENAGQAKIAVVDSGENGERTAEFLVDLAKLRVLSISYGFAFKGTARRMFTSIESSFKDVDSGLPTEVSILETKDGRDEKKVSFVVNSSNRIPSEEDFSLTSLNIPYGAPLVDYRINRVVGHWDGLAFVEQLPLERPRKASWWYENRSWLVGVIVGIGVFVAIVWVRRTSVLKKE